MFYQEKLDCSFRFGDVVKGFISITPTIDKLIYHLDESSYNINIKYPSYCVILSPCCSISEKIITLAPLIPVRSTFFKNPFFAEDLTKINIKIQPEKTLAPQDWERLTPEQKTERINKGMGYTFLELFIYEKHDIFKKYKVHIKDNPIETNYYMIDFRDIFHVKSSLITSPKQVPIESKCLQLSIETRAQLRDKISFYYARIPDEDFIVG